MIVGRINEQKTLKELYQSKRAEFLVLYGRRRVGKTYLIKEFFSKKKCIYFQVTGIKDGDMSEQLYQFNKAISTTFYNGSRIEPGKNWFRTFENLTDAIKNAAPENQKIILFIDEFPWMATHKSKAVQALEYYWNQFWTDDPRIKLVLCGSSASWMINKIINNTGGLHNRLTYRIPLEPFNLHETKHFLAAKDVILNNWQISQIYMVTGGIPFYLSQIKKGLSSSQAIELIAFQKESILLKEFDNLFSSLFTDAEPYIEILRIIANHRYGISQSQIAAQAKLNSKGGTITEKLNDLAQTGFILRFTPHFSKKRGIYYRVIDEYTLFYLHWIDPLRDSTLQEKVLKKGYWRETQASAAWHSWSGYAFEAMVYKHLPQVMDTLNIPASAIANVWRFVPRKNTTADGAQIDLLFDWRDDVITLCEIKYSPKQFTITKQYAEQLKKKCHIFRSRTRTKKQLFMSMICARNIKENAQSKALINGVVTLDDLFEPAD